MGQAAQLSYFFLLAVFPFLLLITAALGLMAKTGSEVYENLLSYARQILPYSAFHLVFDTLKQVQSGAGCGKLGFGLIGTLWAASSGMGALMDGLNRAYEMRETRPWWRARVIAIELTIMLSVFLIGATALILSGGRLGQFVAGYFGYETYFVTAWAVVEWPLVLAFLAIAFGILYRYAPDVKRGRWHEVLPGSLVGITLWIAVSLLFRLYLHFFDSYNATYGSLGAVIVLMLWFYLSGLAVLIGAEVNSEIEKLRTKPGL